MSGGVTVRLRSTGSVGCVFIFIAIVDHAGVNDGGPTVLTWGWLCEIWVPYDEVGAPGQFGGVVYQELVACGACSSIGASWISIVALLLATCSCVSSAIGDKVPLYHHLTELVPALESFSGAYCPHVALCTAARFGLTSS